MIKLITTLLLSLVTFVLSAQIRVGYVNYLILNESGQIIAADSIDTNRDWRISPSGQLVNADFDKLYTMWDMHLAVGNPLNVFPQKGLIYDNPSWVGSLADSKITWSGMATEHVKGDGTFDKIDYWNSGTTTSGQVIFYLTTDKTSTGIGLYTYIDYVNPIINDAASNYSYEWTYNPNNKTLIVSANVAPHLFIPSASATLLGVPTQVANGTLIHVAVKGH